MPKTDIFLFAAAQLPPGSWPSWTAVALLLAAALLIGVWLREIFRSPAPAAQPPEEEGDRS